MRRPDVRARIYSLLEILILKCFLLHLQPYKNVKLLVSKVTPLPSYSLLYRYAGITRHLYAYYGAKANV